MTTPASQSWSISSGKIEKQGKEDNITNSTVINKWHGASSQPFVGWKISMSITLQKLKRKTI